MSRARRYLVEPGILFALTIGLPIMLTGVNLYVWHWYFWPGLWLFLVPIERTLVHLWKGWLADRDPDDEQAG